MFSKILKGLGMLLLLLIVVYFLGPKAAQPQLDTTLPFMKTSLLDLEQKIIESENQVANLKPDNEARIIWADTASKEKTAYSIVYLHGFSASQGEGDPIHLEFAKRYGCNLYLSRLHGHGITTKDGFLNTTPENLIKTAKEAIAIGKQLGERVILMSCSTGSTLALYLSAGNPDLFANILYSPNIDMFDSKSSLLTGPWGYQILKFMMEGKHRGFEATEAIHEYWTTPYRIEGIIHLKSLIQATMKEETFKKIKQPLFLGYYYKSETEQDEVVSIVRMKEMFEQISTPLDQKRQIAFDKVGGHVLCSKLWSKDLESVRKETFSFAEEVLRMRPVTIKSKEVLEMQTATAN